MAKIELGKTYRTRDGRPARIHAVDIKGESYPVLASIEEDGREWTYRFSADGRYEYGCNFDLIEVTPHYTRWMVMHPGYGFMSQGEAVKAARTIDNSAVVRVAWYEGEGLDAPLKSDRPQGYVNECLWGGEMANGIKFVSIWALGIAGSWAALAAIVYGLVVAIKAVV
jgi:hypothetical protein